MKLDDRDITCETDYTPLSNAELVEAIEQHVAIMYTSPIIDFDLEWIIGPARALLARAEAAEALAYERLENMLFAEQRANDAANDATDAELHLRRAEQAAEQLTAENRRLTARVAELEAALAAQQWRPVTDDWPPYNERVIIGHGGGYDGGWFAFAQRVRADNRNEDDWLMDDDTLLAFESAVVAMPRPLPPAPQETTP